ncbi:hypothetical protein ACFO26_04660 [Lactococcus nasutitermitis]|uniref:Uncharacterized protein n=1 Tax=Lactococcus nasutitermitis TaxID=1652957 RepID=A0ABV9JD25_9LACT|nr:hypothetical protein [Lactococcus nasutitermitis]
MTSGVKQNIASFKLSASHHNVVRSKTQTKNKSKTKKLIGGLLAGLALIGGAAAYVGKKIKNTFGEQTVYADDEVYNLNTRDGLGAGYGNGPTPAEEGQYDGNGQEAKTSKAKGGGSSEKVDVKTGADDGKSLSNAASNWGKGSYNSSEDSLLNHFDKHGKQVGATTPEQYARKAEGMLNKVLGKVKGKPVEGQTSNVYRYRKGGYYIDIQRGTDNIISFGK